MDQKQTTTYQAVPASLWVGPDKSLIIKVIEHLQKKLCPQDGCNVCITCTQIRTQQHHAIQWYYPEKWYTLEQIKPINATLSFALQSGEQFFFVIQKADCLTRACANSLLKSIEEPPHGYNFIFLAQRQESILPTIRSRCVTTLFYEANEHINHQELFSCFAHNSNPVDFLTILDKSKINERESIELFDAILDYWITQFKAALAEEREKKPSEKMITILQAHAKKLPMTGSSKLFWRNLFLQMNG